MQTKYEYINFVSLGSTSKTSKWSINSNRTDDSLGEIKWYPAWRTYCFYPVSDTIFNIGCLKDISHFINQLLEDRKNNSIEKGLFI